MKAPVDFALLNSEALLAIFDANVSPPLKIEGEKLLTFDSDLEIVVACASQFDLDYHAMVGHIHIGVRHPVGLGG